MPPSVLAAWNRRFPQIRTIQAYGMSELGILPTRSKEPGSLLFSIQDEEVKYRVVEGELQIHTATAMIGYLNAPSPFTEDGWLRTGDEAVLEQGYIRILGRRSEIINIGDGRYILLRSRVFWKRWNVLKRPSFRESRVASPVRE